LVKTYSWASAHIHVAGYVHFDIKPSKRTDLQTQGPRGLLLIFGQSRAIGAGGAITLPALYWTCVPPEALPRSPVTVLADVYQAGPCSSIAR